MGSVAALAEVGRGRELEASPELYGSAIVVVMKRLAVGDDGTKDDAIPLCKPTCGSDSGCVALG